MTVNPVNVPAASVRIRLLPPDVLATTRFDVRPAAPSACCNAVLIAAISCAVVVFPCVAAALTVTGTTVGELPSAESDRLKCASSPATSTPFDGSANPPWTVTDVGERLKLKPTCTLPVPLTESDP